MKKTLVCMATMGIAGGLASAALAEDPYVESDGTQAVVLDYFVNPKTKIVADFAFQAPLTRQWRIFGVEGSSAVFACLYISNGDVYSWSWKNSSGNYGASRVPSWPEPSVWLTVPLPNGKRPRQKQIKYAPRNASSPPQAPWPWREQEAFSLPWGQRLLLWA